MQTKQPSSARAFTLALQHDKEGNEITEETLKAIALEHKGAIDMFYIFHDKDFNNETGEITPKHAHILLKCKNPYTISTIANKFNVAPNMVEVVRSFNTMLRYLTHLDNPEKAKYEMEQVKSNTKESYQEIIATQDISIKEIYQDIKEHGDKAIERYLGVVPVITLSHIKSMTKRDHERIVEQQLIETNARIKDLARELCNIEAYNKKALAILEEFKCAVMMLAKEAPRFVEATKADIGNCIVIISKAIESVAGELHEIKQIR